MVDTRDLKSLAGFLRTGSSPVTGIITDTVIDTIVSITVSFFMPEKTLLYGGFYGQRVQTASADLGMEDFRQILFFVFPFYCPTGMRLAFGGVL